MNQAPANLEKPPTLQLPAEFLSKYRPARRTPVVVLEPKIENQPPTEQEVNMDTKGSQEDTIHENIAPLRAPTKATQEYFINVKGGLPTALLDTKIRWAMSSLAPAFKDDEEKRWAKGDMVNTKQGSYFWEHVVRYLPNPTEKNLYRTVMIDYIPHGATYQDVLQHVRTGAVESIQMFSPLRGSTNYWTARVVFTYELPAVSMIMHYQKKLHQGAPIMIMGTPVRVWQVLQPTYPANKLVETDIFQHGYTRILLLENVEDSGVLPKLHKKLERELRDDAVIEINRTADGVPMVEFTSVAVAAGAMRRLEGDREFKGCIFDFDRDYCDDGYESN